MDGWVGSEMAVKWRLITSIHQTLRTFVSRPPSEAIRKKGKKKEKSVRPWENEEEGVCGGGGGGSSSTTNVSVFNLRCIFIEI